jgi:hypothetical protein
MSVATVIDKAAVAARARIENDCRTIDAGSGVLLFVDASDDLFEAIANVAKKDVGSAGAKCVYNLEPARELGSPGSEFYNFSSVDVRKRWESLSSVCRVMLRAICGGWQREYVARRAV